MAGITLNEEAEGGRQTRRPRYGEYTPAQLGEFAPVQSYGWQLCYLLIYGSRESQRCMPQWDEGKSKEPYGLGL